MKIVIISNSAAPSKNASSLQVSKLCESLSILNHKVTLILPNTGTLSARLTNVPMISAARAPGTYLPKDAGHLYAITNVPRPKARVEKFISANAVGR